MPVARWQTEQQRRIAALYQSAAANPGDEVVKQRQKEEMLRRNRAPLKHPEQGVCRRQRMVPVSRKPLVATCGLSRSTSRRYREIGMN